MAYIVCFLGTVLGAIVMEGYYVVYNRENKTIQFAESKCNVIDPGAIRSTIQGNISLTGKTEYHKFMNILYRHLFIVKWRKQNHTD